MKAIYRLTPLLSLLPQSQGQRTFKNDKVFKIPRHHRFDLDLVRSFELMLGPDNFDIFKDGRDETHVYVSASEAENFKNFLIDSEIPSEILVDDLQSVIDEEIDLQGAVKRGRWSRFSGEDFNYRTYHDYYEVNEWIDMFQEQYSDFVTVENVGNSYEGRIIRALKISNPTVEATRSSLFFSGQHAREWLSPASTMLVFENMMQNYLAGNFKEVALLDGTEDGLEPMEFYYIPMMNPDTAH